MFQNLFLTMQYTIQKKYISVTNIFHLQQAIIVRRSRESFIRKVLTLLSYVLILNVLMYFIRSSYTIGFA